jgi:hypothetical protein
MHGINDRMVDAHFPQCDCLTVYVERVEMTPQAESDAYLCRCDQCGWRFRVFTPAPMFAAEAASLA